MIDARESAKKQGDVILIGNIYARMRIPNTPPIDNDNEEDLIFTQRIMRWYASQLLRPKVKILVLVVFAGLFGWSVWRTTLLTQAFNVEDYVPADSYTKTFFSSRTLRLATVSFGILLLLNDSTLSHFFFSRPILEHQDVNDSPLP